MIVTARLRAVHLILQQTAAHPIQPDSFGRECQIMAKHYYKHLDPTRDFCEGETHHVEMDPLRLLRDLSEALYLIRRTMNMQGGEDAGYLQLFEKLEEMERELAEALNDYAEWLRPEGTAIVVKWVEELGDANYEFGQQHGEEE